MKAPLPDDGRSAFSTHLRPRVAELLRSIGLDVVYHQAQGDRLYFLDERGHEVEVLDMLGGYGASLFGHNHPELVAAARRVLDARRPFLAQASVRGEAGKLGLRLSEVVKRTTGKDYVVTLANSGTEAAEAALKHAEMERCEQNDALLRRLGEFSRKVRLRLRERSARVPDGLLDDAASRLGVPRVSGLDELFALLHHSLRAALEAEPCFLAVAGGFHGKTTGALKLTHNAEFRNPFRRAGVRVGFVLPEDEQDLVGALERERVSWTDLELAKDGTLRLVERSRVNVSALFAEPIQGEGGIRPLSDDYLRALRRAADLGDFPLVLDEIQSGMGRTGTFLASEPSGVRADYYLLSKALGGGLAKLSALMVEAGRYLPEFGKLHTSTFADDDFSSAVGQCAVELVTRDDGALMRKCAETGEHLREKLLELQARFPGQLRGVRGRGLLLGFELGPQLDAPSPLLRVLSEQNLLGYVASGYLLAEHRVRVAPTLSAHGTIRLEPSAYISRSDLDRFLLALTRLLSALRDSDVLALCGFIAGRAPKPDDRAPDASAAKAMLEPPRPGRRHIAFLAHFLEPSDLRAWEPRFSPLSDGECERFLERTKGLLEPFVVERARVKGKAGDEIELTVLGIPFTPAQVMEALREGKPDWAIDLVRRGVEEARLRGCSVVGFGGYTSIVTDNCRAIVEDELTLTSGNTLTAAAALEGLFRAAERLGVPGRRLGVLGAAGNIGAVLAEVASDRVPSLLLVGRAATRTRLERAAAELYQAAYARLLRGEEGGLAGALRPTQTLARLLERKVPVHEAGLLLAQGLSAELGEGAPVQVAEDLGALRGCDLILCATNSARPVVLPEHLAEGPLVICDVAAPRDVDPSVHQARPRTLVLKGGMVRAPFGQNLGLSSLRLGPGQLYGCLAETLLLGLAGLREHFSYGKLTAERVRWVRELAQAHGFDIDEDVVTG